MAREPPPWRSLFFLLPVPLQVIRSRDSFTPRTTGIQLLSAVVLEESISSCRKQFDIQQFLLFDLVFKYGLIEFGKAVSLCLLLCHGRLLSNPLSVFFDQTAQIMIFASVEVFFSYFLVIWASYWKHVEFYVKWSWRTKPSKRGQLARAVLPRKQITYQNTYCTAVEV